MPDDTPRDEDPRRFPPATMTIQHCAPGGTRVFHARSLETGVEAIIVTEPLKQKRIDKLAYPDRKRKGA